jgi:hypothetical protein
MLHPQINAHKESLPFLMSKKWEAVQAAGSFFKRCDKNDPFPSVPKG